MEVNGYEEPIFNIPPQAAPEFKEPIPVLRSQTAPAE